MMTATTNKTALITGASSGIGLELTRCFARDGHSVIMVAHHEEKLASAVAQIKAEFPNVQIESIACDLSKDGAAAKLYADVQARGIPVEFLINNAGFGERGSFLETDLQKEVGLIHLNIIALVSLTKFFAQDMVKRGSGRILQLGSVASFIPHPLLAVYAASKAFILSFTEALQVELKDTGISLTVLCPPPTDTNFFEVANMENTKIANSSQVQSAVDVAEAGYEGLMKGEARVLPTFVAKMYAAQGIALPDAFNAAMTKKQLENVKE
ncbi:SDR family NAD(P)-dependent oxidoreductase [Adhaeribacter pallidiroseus]|uniref:3-oxoacyl-[acyl-carrier-protein] reductase n=1 Tax=Adhaeribacter pallidiroseus TaxID=2072847 RepID=A0A369QKU3_9BACT|nr:SDR family oxidoreductase [Adhaeribacter pallidiroseus]RDC62888.1 3-oxoacyl-[acyl-carrier-protein] reductase [Adhaeribacter pallidiroseus]